MVRLDAFPGLKNYVKLNFGLGFTFGDNTLSSGISLDKDRTDFSLSALISV